MIYTKITYKNIVETYYQTHYNSAFSLLEGENAPKLGKQIKKQLGFEESQKTLQAFQELKTVFEEIVEKRTNKDFFANLKAQSWWFLRLRFQNTYRALNGHEYDPDMLISLSSKDINQNEMTQLVMELSQPTYSKNGVGKILVNKQPDGAISPNRADAVMICYCPLVSALDIWSKL